MTLRKGSPYRSIPTALSRAAAKTGAGGGVRNLTASCGSPQAAPRSPARYRRSGGGAGSPLLTYARIPPPCVPAHRGHGHGQPPLPLTCCPAAAAAPRPLCAARPVPHRAPGAGLATLREGGKEGGAERTTHTRRRGGLGGERCRWFAPPVVALRGALWGRAGRRRAEGEGGRAGKKSCGDPALGTGLRGEKLEHFSPRKLSNLVLASRR